MGRFTYRDPLDARQLVQWQRDILGGSEAVGSETLIFPQLQLPCMILVVSILISDYESNSLW